MIKKFLFSVFVLSLCFAPFAGLQIVPVADAEINIDIDTNSNTKTYGSSWGSSGGGRFADLLEEVTGIISYVIILLIAIAVLVFIIGVLKYIARGDDEEERKKGRNLMIYGIISLFVMVSVWGLVNILAETFQLENQYPDDIPYLEKSGSGSMDDGTSR
ncbi:MAG: pilin [bacterium]|nr:pilin [bacterium]